MVDFTPVVLILVLVSNIGHGFAEEFGDTIMFEEFTADHQMSKALEKSGLKWFSEPKMWKSRQQDGKGLEIFMDKGSDFWRKSYYDPPFIHDSGHVLFFETEENVVVSTEFSLSTGMSQFDQGGLVLRVDEEHWLKVGLEFADNKRRLGAVVTNDFSQWSVQEWNFDPVSIRLFRIKDEVVGEVFHPEKQRWEFFFVGHVSNPDNLPVKIGLHAAAPLSDGGSVAFSFLKVERCPKDRQCHHHYNGPPPEDTPDAEL